MLQGKGLLTHSLTHEHTNSLRYLPRDLVQIVYGYGPTGAALVKSSIDKLIFVGSPEIGKIVAKTASDNLLPVVLELGIY